MSKRIRLTESDLHRIINESVNRIAKTQRVNEGVEGDDDYRFLPSLKRLSNELCGIYSRLLDAVYRPQGMNKVIDAIINADLRVKDLIEDIESRSNEYQQPY